MRPPGRDTHDAPHDGRLAAPAGAGHVRFRYDKIKKRRSVSVVSADAWQNYLDTKAAKNARPRKGFVGQDA